jgi:hypothetical protein
MMLSSWMGKAIEKVLWQFGVIHRYILCPAVLPVQ